MLMLSGFCETESFQLCIICKIIYLAVFIELVKEVNKMKILPIFLLVITTILVSTALAAPILDMYSDDIDCRACHNDANILKNTDHDDLHDDSESCSECHAENAPKKLDCMNASGCHADSIIDVANHHELEVESCFTCHEQGVPRGNL